MKRLSAAFCFLAMSLNAHSQSVFTYELKKDLALGAAALGVFASPFFIQNEPAHIPAGLDTEDVNRVDRSVMFPYNRVLDTISDYSVYALLMLPALSLAGNIQDNHAWLSYGIMYAEAFALCFGTKDLLKNAVIRYRPYMYSGGVPDGMAHDYYNSFPSGSTALAFLSAGFVSATFSAEYPDSKWKIPVIAGAYTFAAGVAACRVASGSHFITDVIAGMAIGSLYGWGIPLLHKRNINNNLALHFTGNGFIASLRF